MTREEFIKLRHKLGLSQRGIAPHLGVTFRAVQYWEQGGRAIPEPVALLLRRIMQDHKEGTLKCSTV